MRALKNRDQRLPMRQHFTDLYRHHSRSLEFSAQCGGVRGAYRQEQPAGGLRIKKHCLDLSGDFSLVADHTLSEVAIGVKAAGDEASAYAFERAFEQRDARG